MSRGPHRFTQAEVCRAIKAVERSGVRAAVEVTQGGIIRIVPIEAVENPKPAVEPGRRIAL